MTLRTMLWTGAAAFFGPPLIGLATPRSAPAWIRYAEDGLMLLWGIPASLFILCLLAVLVTPARVTDRAVVRLGTFLSDSGGDAR